MKTLFIYRNCIIISLLYIPFVTYPPLEKLCVSCNWFSIIHSFIYSLFLKKDDMVIFRSVEEIYCLCQLIKQPLEGYAAFYSKGTWSRYNFIWGTDTSKSHLFIIGNQNKMCVEYEGKIDIFSHKYICCVGLPRLRSRIRSWESRLIGSNRWCHGNKAWSIKVEMEWRIKRWGKIYLVYISFETKSFIISNQ